MKGASMTRAVLYARVSTDKQEQEHTIQSQLVALRAYAEDKGYVVVQEFLDDGYSGAALQRPGLDALRDALDSGEFDTVLFHSPDRLARKALYQSLVLEDLEKAGVRPEFLNYPVDNSPEGRIFLGMQGLYAEYDRAKILERTRRGKLHWAREGALVGGHAPYGYRWVKRSESGRARLEVTDYQATVVHRMYTLLTEDRLSTWAIARKLTQEGVPTGRGAAQWQPMAVFRILSNPVYRGAYGYRPSGQDEITIPVPSIVDAATWEAAQSQLEENGQYSRRNNKRHQYLLRGLVRCPRCGGAYTGFVQHGSRGYRCNRAHWSSSSTGTRCPPGGIPADPVETAVWDVVTEALRRPEVLAEEYNQRMKASHSATDLEFERKRVALALKQTKAQEDRVTDAYIHEAMDLGRYKAEMDRLRAQRQELDRAAQEIIRRSRKEQGAKSALQHLERFCDQVSQGLEAMTFEERQTLLRLVVESVTVDDGLVRVAAVIPTDSNGELRNARGELVEP